MPIVHKNAKKTNLAPIALLQKHLLTQANCIRCNKRKNKRAILFLVRSLRKFPAFHTKNLAATLYQTKTLSWITIHYLYFPITMTKLELGILQWQTFGEISIVTEGKGFSSSPMQKNMSRYLVSRHWVAFLYWERDLMLSPLYGSREKKSHDWEKRTLQRVH